MMISAQNIKRPITDVMKTCGSYRHMQYNQIKNCDCMRFIATMPDKSVDFTFTDIPYNMVNHASNGLRSLDKGKANILTFELDVFLLQILRVTGSSLLIFCAKEQFSQIYSLLSAQNGTVRAIVWEKSNPSPMNGQHVYLSGVELAVWFKYRGRKTFNAHCKNTVFRYPNGRSKEHLTEKNHELLKDLILDNTNAGDIVFDPCMGSGSHLLAAKHLNRRFLGCEINEHYFALAKKRLAG